MTVLVSNGWVFWVLICCYTKWSDQFLETTQHSVKPSGCRSLVSAFLQSAWSVQIVVTMLYAPKSSRCGNTSDLSSTGGPIPGCETWQGMSIVVYLTMIHNKESTLFNIFGRMAKSTWGLRFLVFQQCYKAVFLPMVGYAVGA